MGRVIEKTEGALLLVISDHGFSRFDRAVNVNSWLLRAGFLTLQNGADRSTGEMFANVDWSKTRAYAIGLNGIYLNLRGREKNGILNPGPETAETVNDIRLRLLALRDPVNGNTVASAVTGERTSTAEWRLHRPRTSSWDGRQDTAPRGTARSAAYPVR